MEQLNIFQLVKQAVTTRQAASFYGLNIGRNGMCRCPFHNDHTPSMKVDERFHCFGCQADGDVIVGEVSRVNDDANDNHFNPYVAFEKIEEDVTAKYRLCGGYQQ